MARTSKESQDLAKLVREQLVALSGRLVERIEQAKLPGYSVFAHPILEQSARRLYEELAESLEAGDVQPLVSYAEEQAHRRREQGVLAEELSQIAGMFVDITHAFVEISGADLGTVAHMLDAFTHAFTGETPPPEPSPTEPAIRSGGKRMTDRQEKEIDQESMLAQFQHQTRQLEISAQVSRQITASLDLDELLLEVVEGIKSGFDYYHVHIYLLDPESGYLIMREGTGEVGQTLKERGHRIALGNGMVGTVAATGKPLLTADVTQQDNWLANPLLPETKSELTVPIRIGGTTLGVLDVQSNEIGGLGDIDTVLMESLAQQVAVAVQNANLFRETRAVSIISRAVSAGLGMGEVFGAVSRELRAVVDFDYMTVATYYEIVRQVELTGVDDLTQTDIPLEEGVRLPLELCIPGQAILQQRSMVVSDLTDEAYSEYIDAEILAKSGMRSVLSVPLLSHGQITATINLVSESAFAFTAADVHLMEQISGQLAAALENAQIFENIQEIVAQRTSESAELRAMVENTSEAIVLTNVQQIVTYANPAFYDLHGYDPEVDDLTRRSLTSFIVTDDEGALSDELRDHILGGGRWQDQVEHRRQDGTVFSASTTVFAVRDEAGEPIAFAASIRDVTSERRIMAISQVASSTPELGQLAPRVLECIAQDSDIDRAVLILYDEIGEDGPESMSIIAVYDPLTGGERIVNEHLGAEESPFSTVVYHERQAIWVADVATDERLFEDGRALLLEHNIVSMLALPILVRDDVVGMVAIDWRKHVELSYDEISLYQVMVNQVSTAVENARIVAEQQQSLEDALDRRVREVATSIEVGQAIAAAPELESLFERVVTLIKERFGYYHAHVYQVDRENERLEMMAGYGEPGRIMRERGHFIPLGKGLTGTAAVTGETVRVDDVSQQENWLPNPLLPDTKSELAVPIKLGDEILGVLDVQSDRLAGLTGDDELLLLGLCGQIAVSIQNTQMLAERTGEVNQLQALANRNAELLEEIQHSQQAAHRRAQQLEISAGVSEQLTANLDINELLAAVVNLIQVGFDYYHVHIYLIEQETGDLVMMEGTGEPGAVMKERGHRIPEGKGLVGRAATTGQTVLVPDVSAEEGWLANPLLPDTKSELSVPLKMGENVVGVLDVQSNQVAGLGEEDQALLEGLGGQVAVAVQNAQLFGQIEQQVSERTQQVRVFQALAENAADAIAMADLEGKVFYANAAWYEMYGYDVQSDDAIGLDVDKIWPDDACKWMKKAVTEDVSREWRGQVDQILRDDARLTIDLTLFVVRDESGAAAAVAALGRDVTERILSGELTRLVSTASSQRQLGYELLRAVMWGMNVERGSFVVYEGQDEKPHIARTLATFDDKEGAVVQVDRPVPFDEDPINARLFQAGEAIVYNNLGGGADVLDADWRAYLEQKGTVALAALPLKVEAGAIKGMLLLQRRRGPITEDEVSFLIPVLQQVSLALSNLAFREARERETGEILDQRTAQMQTSTEVAQAIASALELDELFERVVTLVKERFDYYHVHLYLVDPVGDKLNLVAGYGEPGRQMMEKGHSIPHGKGLTGTAAVTGEPVLVSDVSQQEAWLPNPLLPDTKSEVAVPIKMGTEVLGVLDVQDDEVGGLNLDTQVMLQGLCGQIAIAIQNTRLLQEMQDSLRNTALLLGLSTALSSLTEPQEIADALAKQLMGIANIERCSVNLCGDYDAKGIPQTVQVYTVNDRDPRQRGWSVGQTYTLSSYPVLLETVVRQRQVLGISDLSKDDRITDAEQSLLQEGGSVSAVVVPMISGERVLGYFCLQDRQPYLVSDEEVELYRGIANQSATAFSNALSLQEVQERLEEANMLYESSRALATAETRDVLADSIVQRIVSTNVDRCEILLYEQRELGPRYLEVVGGWSAAGDVPKTGTRYRLSEYTLADVAKTLGARGTTVFGAGAADQPDALRQMCVSRGILALALVPLKVGQEYLGFLSIERHKSGAFGANILRFYDTVASQSAVALRNLQLIDQTQRQLEQLQHSYDDVTRLADTVRELSSPVIQVWEDVLVLPLVGAIDSRRAMNMMESLLTGITSYQAEQVIIDITGVPVMDTSVANYLLQTIKAASLLGARCMLVGISSEMAQTIVGLGLDLSAITTYSNLRAGIQAALESTGFAIAPLALDDGEQVQ